MRRAINHSLLSRRESQTTMAAATAAAALSACGSVIHGVWLTAVHASRASSLFTHSYQKSRLQDNQLSFSRTASPTKIQFFAASLHRSLHSRSLGVTGEESEKERERVSERPLQRPVRHARLVALELCRETEGEKRHERHTRVCMCSHSQVGSYTCSLLTPFAVALSFLS